MRALLALVSVVSFSAFGQESEPPKELLAVHPSGPVGVFRVISAQRQPAGPLAFGQSVVGTYLNLDDFPAGGQNTQRLTLKAAISYTPITPLELFVAGEALTSNDTDPDALVQQVGNVDFGVKTAADLYPGWSVGAVFLGEYRQPVVDLGLTSSAMNLNFLIAGTCNLTGQGLPLRLHANVGFRADNSEDLVRGSTAGERERVILGVLGENALLAGLGVEVLVSPAVFSIEYTTEQAIDSGAGFADSPQRLTLGARIFPTLDRALGLGVAANFGFFAADGPSRLVREPDFSFIFGMTYLFGTAGRKRPLVEEDPLRDVRRGHLVGRVISADAKQPIGNARLTLCRSDTSPVVTDRDDGTFRSYGLPEGPCEVSVSAAGYSDGGRSVTIRAGQEVSQDFVLSRAAAARGAAMVSVRDRDGRGVKALIRLPDVGDGRSFETDDQGRLRIRLPVGNYRLEAESGGLEAEPQSVNIVEDYDVPMEFVVGAPSRGKAVLRGRSVVLAAPVQFMLGSTELTGDSKAVLDDVVSVLAANPKVRLVEVAGHTDSSGPPEVNKAISLQRAQAVVKYLVQKGVEAGRLRAAGYGQERPSASNDTPEGRLQNRRVEINILE